MRKQLLIFVLGACMLGITANAENPCNTMWAWDTTAWGKSCLWLPTHHSIALYGKPEGRRVGAIFKDNLYNVKLAYTGDRECYKNWSFYPWQPDSMQFIIEQADLVAAGGDSYQMVKILDEQDGFLRVFNNMFRDGLWIKAEDIFKKGAQLFEYRDILLGDPDHLPHPLKSVSEWANIGVNLKGGCLNLRKEPSTNSEKILCIPANDPTGERPDINHFKILKVQEGWTYVKVTTEGVIPEEELDPNEENDCPYRVIKEQHGWVKAIDDNGFPNIWFSTTSY